MIGLIPVIGEAADIAKTINKADDIADIVKLANKADDASDVGKIVDKSALPIKHIPNSTLTKNDAKGNVIIKRFFDEEGKALKDIDYTNHGNPKRHPKVPHKHRWDWSNPKKPERILEDE